MMPLAKKYDPAHVFGTGSFPFGIPKSGKEEGLYRSSLQEEHFNRGDILLYKIAG